MVERFVLQWLNMDGQQINMILVEMVVVVVMVVGVMEGEEVLVMVVIEIDTGIVEDILLVDLLGDEEVDQKQDHDLTLLAGDQEVPPDHPVTTGEVPRHLLLDLQLDQSIDLQ